MMYEIKKTTLGLRLCRDREQRQLHLTNGDKQLCASESRAVMLVTKSGFVGKKSSCKAFWWLRGRHSRAWHRLLTDWKL